MAIAETPGKMYALAAVLSVLAVIAVVLRFYARRLLKTAKIEMDDYMILPALLFTLATALCMFIGAGFGDLGRHTNLDADGMPIFTHRTQIFQMTNFASLLTQTLAFGFTKISVLFFYKRIFSNGRVTYIIWALIGLVNVWTVAFFLANLLQCYPISINWTGWGVIVDSCVDTNAVFLAQAWSDVVTDVLILSLPLPCIWRLQMAISQKIAVSGIFLLGTLVIGAGAAKLVVYHNVVAEIQSHNDVTYLLTPTMYWPTVEASLGIVGACLPLTRPIFRNLSAKGVIHSIRRLIHAPSIRSRKSSGKSEMIEDACSKSTRTVLIQNRSARIFCFIDNGARAKDSLAIPNFDQFDELPDFPSLMNTKSRGGHSPCAADLV